MSPEEVHKQIEELESLQAQTRRWRVCAVLGILLILALGVGSLLNDAASLAREGPRRDVFVQTFRHGLETEIVPDLNRVGKQALAQITPKVKAELEKLNDRAPEVGEVFMKELDTLAVNVRREGTKAVYGTIGEALKKREERIRKLYPDVTDEKVAALANSLVEQANDNLLELSDRLFAEHIKSLASITENINEIKRTERIQGDEELPTWEMAMLVMDLVREELKDFDTSEPAPKPAAPAAKTTEAPAKQEAK